MKKLCLFTLALCMLFSLAACGMDYGENIFFSSEILSQYGIAELPAPSLDGTRYDSATQTFYFTVTKQEFDIYAQQLVTYLQNSEQVFNLGEYRTSALLAEIFPYYIYGSISDHRSFIDTSYDLAYSLSEELELNERDYLYEIQDVIRITLTYHENEEHLRGSDFKYRCSLQITQKDYPECVWDYEEIEKKEQESEKS